jgi:hypothetical protein
VKKEFQITEKTKTEDLDFKKCEEKIHPIKIAKAVWQHNRKHSVLEAKKEKKRGKHLNGNHWIDNVCLPSWLGNF